MGFGELIRRWHYLREEQAAAHSDRLYHQHRAEAAQTRARSRGAH